MPLISRHLLISGKVQGVCFRHYTRQTALDNGVVGWVRNLADGRVEALIEGEQLAVEATVNWCHTGPEWSKVDKVLVAEHAVSQEFKSFEIR